LDSIIVGYYRGKELLYIALVRNGFVRRKDTIVPNVPRLHQNSALESAV